MKIELTDTEVEYLWLLIHERRGVANMHLRVKKDLASQANFKLADQLWTKINAAWKNLPPTVLGPQERIIHGRLVNDDFRPRRK